MTEHPNTRKSQKGQKPKPEHLSVSGVSCFMLPSVLGASHFKLPFAFISPGGSEFILIMLVLILLFGAKDAPRIFRSLHTMLDKVQRTAASFRYRIMYGDLFQDTDASSEKPYDVEAKETSDGGQATGNRSQETGARGQEPGDRSQGTGARGQEPVDRSQEPGNRSQETGDREQAAESPAADLPNPETPN